MLGEEFGTAVYIGECNRDSHLPAQRGAAALTPRLRPADDYFTTHSAWFRFFASRADSRSWTYV